MPHRLPIAIAAVAVVLAVSAAGPGVASASTEPTVTSAPAPDATSTATPAAEPATATSDTASASASASEPPAQSATATATTAPSATAATPGDGSVSFTVVLDPTDRTALRALVQKAPAMTEAQRTRSLAAVAPDTDDRHDVAATLRAAGFDVTESATWQISATGSIAAAESFFDVELVGSGDTLHPTTTPRVPASIASAVTTVLGLDQRPVLSASALPGGSTPADLASAYGVTRSGSDGTGTTVATVQFSGWRQSDLQQYATGAGLAMPSITNVPLGSTTATSISGSGDVEVALDQEMVLATAPKAKQRIYFADNSAQGMYDAWNTLADDVKTAGIDTASTSWGICQSGLATSVQNAVQDAIARAVVNGATVFAASGDYGAYDCASSSNPSAATAADVSFPAVLPSVVGVGGTSLTGGSGSWAETTWSDATAKRGSGGGVSGTTARPSWQSGIGVSGTTRAVPDISATADPNKGVSFYASSVGGFALGGGTSAASPIMAGQLAATLSSRGCTTGVGDVHAALYANPGAFRDITTGNNLLYSAGKGYDLATGLGSPNWSALASALPACTTAADDPAAHAPQGSFDAISGTDSGVTVSGWAFDPDASGATSVRVTEGTTTLATVATSIARADVVRAYPAAPAKSGWSTSVSLTAGTHTVCATAVNVGTGADKQLSCKTYTVAHDTSHDPLGSFDAISGTDSGVTVSGWAFDPDASGATSVRVTEGTTTLATVATSIARADVARAYSTAPAKSGWSTSVSLTAGTHTVCATAVNVATGADKQISCKTYAVAHDPSHDPRGSFDQASAAPGGIVTLSGWSFDPDTTATTQVAFYDQTGAPKGLGTATTGGARSDVARVIAGAPGNTGFSTTVTLSFGTHTVCAYGINAGQGSTNPLLGCRSVTVTNTPPRGSLDSVTGGSGTVSFSGWAFDADAGSAPTKVVVYDQTSGARGLVTLSTGGSRPDVARAVSGAPTTTGFSGSAAMPAGTRTVCAYALDSPGGDNPLLGCRSVVVR